MNQFSLSFLKNIKGQNGYLKRFWWHFSVYLIFCGALFFSACFNRTLDEAAFRYDIKKILKSNFEQTSLTMSDIREKYHGYEVQALKKQNITPEIADSNTRIWARLNIIEEDILREYELLWEIKNLKEELKDCSKN